MEWVYLASYNIKQAVPKKKLILIVNKLKLLLTTMKFADGLCKSPGPELLRRLEWFKMLESFDGESSCSLLTFLKAAECDRLPSLRFIKQKTEFEVSTNNI